METRYSVNHPMTQEAEEERRRRQFGKEPCKRLQTEMVMEGMRHNDEEEPFYNSIGGLVVVGGIICLLVAIVAAMVHLWRYADKVDKKTAGGVAPYRIVPGSIPLQPQQHYVSAFGNGPQGAIH